MAALSLEWRVEPPRLKTGDVGGELPPPPKPTAQGPTPDNDNVSYHAFLRPPHTTAADIIASVFSSPRYYLASKQGSGKPAYESGKLETDN
ncbi:hypothetical protein HYU18_00055 [Candidatus Woesearchaeota archaeon]|nr:hypothetical protein [Candidatus Woesearchaeota archaeon]